jgi:arsenate reductase
MAEALVNHYFGDRFEAQSAGTHPTQINPYAIVVLDEVGIDISHQRSKSIDEFKNQTFDTAVTVCDRAKESCPFFPGASKILHKSFEDPAKIKGTHAEVTQAFREARNAIMEWIKNEFIMNTDRNDTDMEFKTTQT